MSFRGGSVRFNGSTSYRHIAVLVVVAGAAVGTVGCSDATNSLERVGVASDPLIWVEEQKLIASDGATWDTLGRAVSLSGDTALVGAPYDDDLGVDSGAAYVFVRSGDQWSEQQKLVASDGGYVRTFGSSVALDGDTAVVGALGYPGQTGGGSAYVFVRTGGAWVEQQKLVASGVEPYDGYGCSVAVSGDVALVGAYNGSGNSENSGAVYAFARTGNVWTEEQKLFAQDNLYGGHFGGSVSVSGDTALVGDTGQNPDAAYVFVRSGGVWTEQQKLADIYSGPGTGFGRAVSVSGDTAFVGAYQHTVPTPGAGSAYAYVRSGGVWTEQQKLAPGDGAPGDGFGWSVSVDGDSVLVGVYNGYDSLPQTSAAYVFVRQGSVWTEQQKLVASDEAPGNAFGGAVSLSGDTAVVGSSLNDAVAPKSGAAYVFVLEKTIGDPCSQDDECMSGFCVDGVCCGSVCGGGDPGDCVACSVVGGAATDGVCGPVADGNSCDDADACTLSDMCQAGACVGGDSVVCTPEDDCNNEGSCEPLTGLCSALPKPDGTPCPGGTCFNGVCTPPDAGGGGAEQHEGGQGGPLLYGRACVCQLELTRSSRPWAGLGLVGLWLTVMRTRRGRRQQPPRAAAG